MKLSSRGDYAVRALLELATMGTRESLTVAEIAERTSIAPKYLEQLMRQLATAGVVRGRRGPSGGYRLERAPEEITVGEVIRVMDGPLAPTSARAAPSTSPVLRIAAPTRRTVHSGTCGSKFGTPSQRWSTRRALLTSPTELWSVGRPPAPAMRSEGAEMVMEQPPTSREQEILAEVLRAIRALRFGHVQVIVQDAQVVQIETLEKKRMDRPRA